jgi:hypothetical protein
MTAARMQSYGCQFWRGLSMKIKLLCGIVFLMACMVCPAVFAQEEAPKFELFGGFASMSIAEPYFDRGGSRGVEASFTGNINSSVGIKGDFGVNIGNVEGDGHVRRYTFMGGPQFTKRTEKLNVFGHVLAGLARIDDGTSRYAWKANGLGLAFGGGVDWKIAPNVGWRVVQVDYMPVRWEGTFSHYVRVSTGVLIPLGK